jgi:hypothetical protein
MCPPVERADFPSETNAGQPRGQLLGELSARG